MILINKNTANNVVLTLTEKVTLISPLFMLNLIHKQTKKEFNLMITDISLYTDRYNEFVITEMVGGDPLLGEIELLEGDFKYTAYEVAAPTLITPNTGIVEIGICKVVGVGQTEYTNNDTTTDKVYER